MTGALEEAVARHYARADLEETILTALRRLGRDPGRLAPDDLGGVDEFHQGGRAATAALADDLALQPGESLLDLGCGLGGPARFFAAARGCRVTGIDLTEDYVRVARSLTRRCGLADRVEIRHGSALDLPFAAGSFDVATLIHVGMNIPDKARLFAAVRRVLRPGGRFGLYEAVRSGEGPLAWPQPWAAGPETSFLESAATYRRLLAEAGFTLTREQDRRDLARRHADEMRERAAREGPPLLGLHLVLGPTAKERLRNVTAAVAAGAVAPMAFVARV